MDKDTKPGARDSRAPELTEIERLAVRLATADTPEEALAARAAFRTTRQRLQAAQAGPRPAGRTR